MNFDSDKIVAVKIICSRYYNVDLQSESANVNKIYLYYSEPEVLKLHEIASVKVPTKTIVML